MGQTSDSTTDQQSRELLIRILPTWEELQLQHQTERLYYHACCLRAQKLALSALPPVDAKTVPPAVLLTASCIDTQTETGLA